MDYARLVRSAYPFAADAINGRKNLCPENLPKQIHQRSQRRQPRRLPSPLSQNQQKNRKTTSFMILFKIRCLDSSSVMPFFKASSIDMTGYASTTGFSSE